MEPTHRTLKLKKDGSLNLNSRTLPENVRICPKNRAKCIPNSVGNKSLQYANKKIEHFTLTFPQNVREINVDTIAGAQSSFPMRQSSIVHTFKQQQRINLVRNMFQDLSTEESSYHRLSNTDHHLVNIHEMLKLHFLRYTKETSKCDERSAAAEHRTSSPPRLKFKIKTLNSKTQEPAHSISSTDNSQCFLSNTTWSEPRYSNIRRGIQNSIIDIDTVVNVMKRIHYNGFLHHQLYIESCRQQLRKINHYLELVKSVKCPKKKLESSKLIQERLEYYQQTYRILNYYLNHKNATECLQTTEPFKTSGLDCVLGTTQAMPCMFPVASSVNQHVVSGHFVKDRNNQYDPLLVNKDQK